MHDKRAEEHLKAEISWLNDSHRAKQTMQFHLHKAEMLCKDECHKVEMNKKTDCHKVKQIFQFLLVIIAYFPLISIKNGILEACPYKGMFIGHGLQFVLR